MEREPDVSLRIGQHIVGRELASDTLDGDVVEGIVRLENCRPGVAS